MNWWKALANTFGRKHMHDAVRTEPCPKCGTMDCIPKAKLGIRGAGQMYVVGGSKELSRTCKFRQQLRQAAKLKGKTLNI